MPISVNTETKAAAIKLLESGNKIEAIKLIREQSGSGLKEAKEFVDSLVDEHNKNLPENQKIGKSGCLLFLLIGTMLLICS
jgi:ribosomal protein L7/L12